MALNNRTTFKLSSGFRMPAISFGTCVNLAWLLRDLLFNLLTYLVFHSIRSSRSRGGGECSDDCTPDWISPYRFRSKYENGVAVGRGIKASGNPREDLFVRWPFVTILVLWGLICWTNHKQIVEYGAWSKGYGINRMTKGWLLRRAPRKM